MKLCVLPLPFERAAEICAGKTRRNIRLVPEELTAVRKRVEGTAIIQTSHCRSAVAALLKKLDSPIPKPILALQR